MVEATLVFIASQGEQLGTLQHGLRRSGCNVFNQDFSLLETIFLTSLHFYEEPMIVMEKKNQTAEERDKAPKLLKKIQLCRYGVEEFI